MTDSPGELVVEVALAGVVLIVLGSALGPLLPFNAVLLGSVLIFLAFAVGVVALGGMLMKVVA